MSSKYRILIVGMLAGLVLGLGNFGCGGSSANQPPAISVSLSQITATVQPQATAHFTATASNDSSGKGVTWSMTCNGATCGSVSPTATASGAQTTYTAPGPPGVTLKVTLTATSVADPTKSASVAITVPAPAAAITVSISPVFAAVPSGGAQQFTATVSNDPRNGGVTWQLLIAPFCLKAPCPAPQPCSICGTISPTSSASGALTYTAPAQVPLFVEVLVSATSVTDKSVGAAVRINLQGISVSMSPTSAIVALNGTQQFTATVKNDGTNQGVTWPLTQSGVACAPGCGTISPVSTASGAAATYTAPATAPPLPVLNVTATSIEDPIRSASASVALTTSTGGLPCSAGSGNESLLKGQYAFLLQGLDSLANNVIASSVTADGTGQISGGEEDILRTNVSEREVSINATRSLYAVGPDRRGCMTLTNANGTILFFRFALGSINSSSIATAGHIMELDDTTRKGTRTVGTLRLQDPTSFTANQFKGDYTFGSIGGLAGCSNCATRLAIAGTFASDGISSITSNTIDIDTPGGVASNLSNVPGGSFSCCSPNGRGVLHLGSSPSDFTFYMINSGDIFLEGSLFDAGEAIAIPSGTTFSQASLNGSSVLRETAQSSSGPVVDIASVSADGKSAMTVNDNINSAGTFSTGSTGLSYTVASNGRVTFTGGSTPPVIYLYGPNQGFLVGADPDVTFGILEPQAAGPFSNTSFSGAYVLGIENPSTNTVTMESGVLTADGSGNAAGTVGQSSSTALPQSQSLNLTYSFPANGVGNVGSGTTAILISGNKLVFINNTTPTPTIIVVEK